MITINVQSPRYRPGATSDTALLWREAGCSRTGPGRACGGIWLRLGDLVRRSRYPRTACSVEKASAQQRSMTRESGRPPGTAI